MALTKEFIDLCKKMIRIDSTPTSGNEEIAYFCQKVAVDAGLEVTLQPGKLGSLTQYNVIARPKNSVKKNEIIFQTHIDTVEPGPMGNWTKTDNNAFQATIDGDRIYGLGTADVKLDFLCKLTALSKYTDVKLKRPFALVGTYGEEVGMHGAQLLLSEKAVDAEMAIIGEPSELQIVYANNGYLVLDFEIPYLGEEKIYRDEHAEKNSSTQEKVFHGKAVHSSTPHLGDNAVHKLIDYLARLPEGVAVVSAQGGSSVNTVPADAFVEIDAHKTFATIDAVGSRFVKLAREIQKLDREFLNFEDTSFSPSHPTLNIGLVKTDSEKLMMTVSVRVTPNISQTLLESWVEKMKKAALSVAGVCRQQRLSPAALTPLTTELVTNILEISKKLGLKDTPITKASGTECSVYRKFGIDCVVFGPGVSIGNSHTANEFNFLSHLEKACEFYSACVERFCL